MSNLDPAFRQEIMAFADASAWPPGKLSTVYTVLRDLDILDRESFLRKFAIYGDTLARDLALEYLKPLLDELGPGWEDLARVSVGPDLDGIVPLAIELTRSVFSWPYLDIELDTVNESYLEIFRHMKWFDATCRDIPPDILCKRYGVVKSHQWQYHAVSAQLAARYSVCEVYRLLLDLAFEHGFHGNLASRTERALRVQGYDTIEQLRELDVRYDKPRNIGKKSAELICLAQDYLAQN